MIYRDKFKVGDKVTWRNRNCRKWAPRTEILKNSYQEPFKITEIEDLPEDSQAVGHTQWVRIDADYAKWSGAWFKKVEDKHG